MRFIFLSIFIFSSFLSCAQKLDSLNQSTYLFTNALALLYGDFNAGIQHRISPKVFLLANAGYHYVPPSIYNSLPHGRIDNPQLGIGYNGPFITTGAAFSIGRIKNPLITVEATYKNLHHAPSCYEVSEGPTSQTVSGKKQVLVFKLMYAESIPLSSYKCALQWMLGLGTQYTNGENTYYLPEMISNEDDLCVDDEETFTIDRTEKFKGFLTYVWPQFGIRFLFGLK